MSDKQDTVFVLPLHYNGHQIRTHIDEMGLFWWVAQDVGDSLGIVNVRQNLAKFPSDETGVCFVYTSAGAREVLTLSEPGLYRLIFQSNKPEAEQLKRWVFHDVLPSLRRTGSYAISQPQDQLTPQGQLPAPTPRVREHAEVSWHLAAVWSLLYRTNETLSNHEIAQRTGIAQRTARAHTRYLLQLGMLELHETFPRHLYVVCAQAERRNAGVYQRLQKICAVIEARQTF